MCTFVLTSDVSSFIAAGVDTSDFSLFSVTISLTQKGMSQHERVLDLFFQWVAMIRNTLEEDGLMQEYHDELRQIAEVNFRFRENGNPTGFCTAAAKLLFAQEPRNILSSASLTSEYDPEVTKQFFDRVKPENSMINVWNSDFGKEDCVDWETEKWYAGKYKLFDISSDQQESWSNPSKIDERLNLPELNKFVPTDFSIRSDNNGLDPEDVSNLSTPTVLLQENNLRMWHKMDHTWRVPKTVLRVALLSPDTYSSPRIMTLNRIFEKVLDDDLNSFAYSASLAGCHYKVSVAPNGYRISVRGYSEKLPALLETVTSRILSLIAEMKEGDESRPGLALKFRKAKEGLLRQSKNHRLTAPYKLCSYNTRLLSEENVWHVNNYVDEMEGEYADKNPLTMKDCAEAAETSLAGGRLNAEALCMGNIDTDEAKKVAQIITKTFLDDSRPLSDVEKPSFRALKLPTVAEAKSIFGDDIISETAPLVFQEVSCSESEENNANELVFQFGCDQTMGYEGVAVLSLMGNMAYNSAYSQLRTKEQLGYIVSAQPRKASGRGWSFVVMVQSSVALPSHLQERSEAWLLNFRKELEDMSLEEVETETDGVIAQLLGRITGLGEEVGKVWGDILNTEALPSKIRTPNFERVKLVAEQLKGRSPSELKEAMLEMFDRYLAVDSPERRAMSSRVYSQKFREEFDENEGKPGVLSSLEDVQNLKEYLSTYPSAPYWAVDASN